MDCQICLEADLKLRFYGEWQLERQVLTCYRQSKQWRLRASAAAAREGMGAVGSVDH